MFQCRNTMQVQLEQIHGLFLEQMEKQWPFKYIDEFLYPMGEIKKNSHYICTNYIVQVLSEFIQTDFFFAFIYNLPLECLCNCNFF